MEIWQVIEYMRSLQEGICLRMEELDERGKFQEDGWSLPNRGRGASRTLTKGGVFEKAGVNFSHFQGKDLPKSAAVAARKFKQGSRFEATGMSLVMHPDNPYVPAAHCNVRFFCIFDGEAPIQWWFGGGYDLTPYYPFMEDVVHWHRCARAACRPFGDDVYPRCKQWCDEYFYLPHRKETRGVGGLFFDDLNVWDWERCFAFIRSVGDSLCEAYIPIVRRRKDIPYTKKQLRFQRYRRARYVEFNLLYDRGTLFGLQSGGRCESILMSMPPKAIWRYNWQPRDGSPEAVLYKDFLRPRDWLAEAGEK